MINTPSPTIPTIAQAAIDLADRAREILCELQAAQGEVSADDRDALFLRRAIDGCEEMHDALLDLADVHALDADLIRAMAVLDHAPTDRPN
jgi:hypothetical protein